MEVSKHVFSQISEGPDMTVGDVCMGCSDPSYGIWVPASFCEEARADMEDYYNYDQI